MNAQFYSYLGITLLSIVMTAGIFLGTTNTTFKSVEKTLEILSKQIAEVRDEQKETAILTQRVYGAEIKIKNLEKCQDHSSAEMDAVQVRLNQLRKDI